MVQHPSSHSCRDHPDDGQLWRRHDILQINSHSKTAESGVPSSETATPVVPEPKPIISPETSSHPPDNSAQLLPSQVLCCIDHPALTDLLRD